MEERPTAYDRPASLSRDSLFPPPFDKLVPFLGNLGVEIDLGREQRDPNALMSAAILLHQAELLLDKRSRHLSAEQLMHEATEMAWRQKNPEALSRSVQIWSDPRMGPTNLQEEKSASDHLKEVRQERSEMMQRRRCRLIFHNKTDTALTIYLNEHPLGVVAARQSHEVPDVLAGRQYLQATHSRLSWGPRQVFVGPGEVFHWKLFD